jgi:hypothetical protein
MSQLTTFNTSSLINVFNPRDYMDKICENSCININIDANNKLVKINDESMIIPTFNTYDLMLKYNYNLNQLKTIAKQYKIKLTATKPVLFSKIYSYLYLSFRIISIQKYIRGHLQRKYNLSHGPAAFKRTLCTNACDFLSMEDMLDIPFEQFFSYKDDDGLIYGFDLLSLHNLIIKSNGSVKNPFTTKQISSKVIDDFRKLIRLSRLLKVDIITEIRNVSQDITDKKSVELRTLTLFQNIDALGNYSDPQWFLELNRIQMIKFLRELIDIWNYRAPLTIQTKQEICPPYGNPFSTISTIHLLNIMETVDDVRKAILICLEKMVTTGIDKDSKCLGAYYVLGALTLVNNDAATALPWLFQAVSYI